MMTVDRSPIEIESEALRRVFSGDWSEKPEIVETPEEEIDFNGLSHQELEAIGQAEDCVSQLLVEHGGDATAAFLSIGNGGKKQAETDRFIKSAAFDLFTNSETLKVLMHRAGFGSGIENGNENGNGNGHRSNPPTSEMLASGQITYEIVEAE